MKNLTKILGGLAIAGAATLSAEKAEACHPHYWYGHHQHPIYAPRFVAPRVVIRPAPVFVPRPFFVQPAPIYVTPPTFYIAPPIIVTPSFW